MLIAASTVISPASLNQAVAQPRGFAVSAFVFFRSRRLRYSLCTIRVGLMDASVWRTRSFEDFSQIVGEFG